MLQCPGERILKGCNYFIVMRWLKTRLRKNTQLPKKQIFSLYCTISVDRRSGGQGQVRSGAAAITVLVWV
jgi:hypothetical protein